MNQLDKHVTKIILGVISVVDIICGGGLITMVLWIAYGLYKIES